MSKKLQASYKSMEKTEIKKKTKVASKTKAPKTVAKTEASSVLRIRVRAYDSKILDA